MRLRTPRPEPQKLACAQAFDAWLPWDTNPLYALLHEAIYCQGAASNWAAQRVRDAHFSADFDAVLAVAEDADVMFTGLRAVEPVACNRHLLLFLLGLALQASLLMACLASHVRDWSLHACSQCMSFGRAGCATQ